MKRKPCTDKELQAELELYAGIVIGLILIIILDILIKQ